MNSLYQNKIINHFNLVIKYFLIGLFFICINNVHIFPIIKYNIYHIRISTRNTL